jgi:hypothetical protein
MHILGIGSKVEISGHNGIVIDIKSIVNLDGPQRMPVVFIKLDELNRVVSALGIEIEKHLTNA